MAAKKTTEDDRLLIMGVVEEHGASVGDAKRFAAWYLMMYQLPKSVFNENMRVHMRKSYDAGIWDSRHRMVRRLSILTKAKIARELKEAAEASNGEGRCD